MHANLQRCVRLGEIIKPWLILGPFYEDISGSVPGLTLHEEPGGSGGERVLALAAEDAGPLLAGAAREGAEATFRGQTARWGLVRGPEQYLTWANWFPANHLATAFVSTVVVPERPGMRRFQLTTRIASQARVAVNGQVVLDSGSGVAVAMEGFDWSEFCFEAPLVAGPNTIVIALFRMGRMARVGFRLELLPDGPMTGLNDGGLVVTVPWADGLDERERGRVEEAIESVSVPRDIVFPPDTVGVEIGAGDGFGLGASRSEALPSFLPTVQLLSPAGNVLRTARPQDHGFVRLCSAEDLADGPYQIRCDWTLPGGALLTAVTYHLVKSTHTPAMPGYARSRNASASFWSRRRPSRLLARSGVRWRAMRWGGTTR